METIMCLKIFIAFSYFPFIKGVTGENSTPAVGIHQRTDGERFVKKIVYGEKISEKPDFLMFTAPYKLCEGECDGITNFVLSFPLYIGKRARDSYKGLYKRDYEKKRHKFPNAPFKKRTTRFTTICNTEPTTESTIEDTTAYTPTESSPGDKTKSKCPKVQPRVCKKKKKVTRDPEINDEAIGISCLLLILYVAEYEQTMLPWERWLWSMPQETIKHTFRRHFSLPIKDETFDCQCPPNRECIIEYKLNADMAKFLNIRGLLSDEEYKKYEREAQRRNNTEKIRRRREDINLDECCCPPRTAQMPTFITEDKFNEYVNRIHNTHQSSEEEHK